MKKFKVTSYDFQPNGSNVPAIDVVVEASGVDIESLDDSGLIKFYNDTKFNVVALFDSRTVWYKEVELK